MTNLKRKRLLLYLVTFFYWFAQYVYNPYMTPYLLGLNISASFAGVIVGMYGSTQLLCRLPLGPCRGQQAEAQAVHPPRGAAVRDGLADPRALPEPLRAPFRQRDFGRGVLDVDLLYDPQLPLLRAARALPLHRLHQRGQQRGNPGGLPARRALLPAVRHGAHVLDEPDLRGDCDGARPVHRGRAAQAQPPARAPAPPRRRAKAADRLLAVGGAVSVHRLCHVQLLLQHRDPKHRGHEHPALHLLGAVHVRRRALLLLCGHKARGGDRGNAPCGDRVFAPGALLLPVAADEVLLRHDGHAVPGRLRRDLGLLPHHVRRDPGRAGRAALHGHGLLPVRVRHRHHGRALGHGTLIDWFRITPPSPSWASSAC